ncbi:hypothetical protein J6590_107373, partial [Homalodisca vitripennis]
SRVRPVLAENSYFSTSSKQETPNNDWDINDYLYYESGSQYVYQPPTTDQRPIANGNRHGRKKQDGGNKKEGGQE